MTLLPRPATTSFLTLRTIAVGLDALLILSAALPVLAAILVALSRVRLLSLSLTALVWIVLLSHGVSLYGRRGPIIDMQVAGANGK